MLEQLGSSLYERTARLDEVQGDELDAHFGDFGSATNVGHSCGGFTQSATDFDDLLSLQLRLGLDQHAIE